MIVLVAIAAAALVLPEEGFDDDFTVDLGPDQCSLYDTYDVTKLEQRSF